MQIEVGLDLTKIKIEKFKEYNIQESNLTDLDINKISNHVVGLDLVSGRSGYKIDISKYELK